MEVQFFLRGKEAAHSNKMCAIYAQINVEGRRGTAFSTKLKVPPRHWQPNDAESPVSPTYYRAAEINAKLLEMRTSMADYLTALAVMHDECSPETLKDLWQKGGFKPKKTPTFLTVLDELIDTKRQKGREGSTLTTYKTRKQNIEAFLKQKFRVDILISQVKYRHCQQLELWMKSQVQKGKPKYCQNNINKHITLIKQVLDHAVNEEYIIHNPIGRLFLDYDNAKPPVYLLPNEREKIENCNIKSLEKERDIAIFLYSTGLSYTDYLSLNSDHLLKAPSGEMFLKKPRDKSEIYSIIPLLQPARKIMAKYEGLDNLPRIDISDFNKTLKILAEVNGIPYRLKTSDFRDTFACMMENEYMIEKRTLMYMMGHTNERQLTNYSAVMPARILYELRKQMPNPQPLNLEIFNQLIA